MLRHITDPDDKREPECKRSVNLVRDIASGEFGGKAGIRNGAFWAIDVKAKTLAFCNDVSADKRGNKVA